MVSPDTITADINVQANSEKHQIARNSVLAAVFLTVLKLIIGVATGSLGILSEALHSGLDLIAAALTLIAVRISGKPADNQHTYGHGKVENISALFETVLLLVTCIWIIYEAIQRLFFKNVKVELSIWAFAIVIVAIVIDWSRSRALMRVALKYHSQALEADALHFSTDIWSSFVVLAGLVCVLAAQVFHVSWLDKADALAALGVSGIVIYVSVRMGIRTITALVDGVPAGIHDDIVKAVQAPGIAEVRQVRIRQSGPEAFADITLSVARDISLVKAHDIASNAENAVRKIMPGADVVVHIDPDRVEHEDMVTTIHVLAGQHGLGAHGVRIYNMAGRRDLELHLEVNPSLSLGEAHDAASEFEQNLREAFPTLQNIVTHIEPSGEDASLFNATRINEYDVNKIVQQLPEKLGIPCDPHSIVTHRVGTELELSFHCSLDPSLSVTDVHSFTERAEQSIRSRIAGIGRVIIHTEPSAGHTALR
ncbi:MAG: cation-efflux pump [Chloroflexi bacterium]|nr:cation-efflux pump [Chloroflexota bacterium]